MLTETQVVAGMNYRFTFRNTDGTFNQIVIYIPIGGALEVFPASAGSILPRLAPIPISGGWTPVTALRSALDALNAVYKQHPQVK